MTVLNEDEKKLIHLNPEDVVDAHANMHLVDEYNALIQKKRLQKDPETGKLLRPWTFSIVQGFFKQSDPKLDDRGFEFIEENFGLAKSSWETLIKDLHKLNEQSPDNEVYKLLFCARHGQGNHNVAVAHFGLKAWDDHYSKLTGTTLEDGTYLKWGPDPFLTKKGEAQADLLNRQWRNQITENGAPIPTKFFSSPFTRSIQTLIRTWDGIAVCKDGEDESKLLAKKRAHPLISENIRETIGEHLCDKRSPKSVIVERSAPYGFEIEDGFAEEDIYYKDDWREQLPEQALRTNAFLQQLFDQYPDEIIYSATHSGQVRAFLTATGHRAFGISTAGMIPIVVKGVRQE
ncbi:unnamed protein product [Ambrosiozyma monospora]|uniref:Unnamed protein product n=1 Tax=Ambrosiozyma monospora TaxID=43982 RepID=A0ACB5SZA3_AMBMO|nr:unnamed protein product [Ambrosiozyma monospora]